MRRGDVRRILSLVLSGTVVLLLSACQSLTGTGTADLTAIEQQPLVVSHSIDGAGKSGIQGQVTVKGPETPLSGAYVNIYQNTISNLLGPSQFISLPTDAEGRYSLEVPPGTYFVVARKRTSGHPTGPLAPGDFYSEHQRIVTRVEAGRIAVVDLAVVPIKAPMFFKSQVVDRETSTGIRGTLVDQAGKPVMGGFAMAYTEAAMQRYPDYASTLSDEQGNFTLYLPEGGTYYLAARIHAWDMPTPGEPYGKYGGEPATAVNVPTDEFVEGIRIEMAPFAGPYQEGKSRRPF